MLRQSGQVTSIIRNYQAVVLMENLLGFRQAFIKLLFQLYLSARAQLAADLQPAGHALRLHDFIASLDPGRLVASFRDWWGNVPETGHGLLHQKVELESHFRPIEAFLRWFPLEIERVQKEFFETNPPPAGDPAFPAVLAYYLNGEAFSKRLEIPTHGDFCRSLSGMFSLLLFTCDVAAERIHLVKPVFRSGEGAEAEYLGFKKYLPHLIEEEFLENSKLTKILDEQWELHETFKRIQPGDTSELGLRTGWTTFTYRTQWKDNRDRRLDYYLGNLNSMQLRPRPDKPLLGFFQMQTPVPGLVEALFPPFEFPGNSRLRKDSAILPLRETDHSRVTSIRAIELPEDWYEQVVDEPYRMAILKAMRDLGHPDWRSLLYSDFENLNRMAIDLRKEVEPLLVSDGIRRFAASIMHELAGDLSRVRQYIGEPELIEGLLKGAHFKIAGFYKFATKVVSSGVQIEDISLRDLIERVWLKGLFLEHKHLEICDPNNPLWQVLLRGYEGDFDFALGMMIRNAAFHKLDGTTVSFHVTMNEDQSIELRWENLTTSFDARELEKRLEQARNGLETGLLFAQEAAQRAFSSPLLHELQPERDEKVRVTCKICLPAESSSKEIFYVHPDCRVRLKS